MPHIRDDLDHLKERLLVMAGAVEEQVRASVQSLVDRDHGLAERVLTGDDAINRLHIEIPSVRTPVTHLSGGQRQAVSVGRAVLWGHHIVLLDEPAAALGVEQTELVLGLIKRLRHEGVAVLLISHNMHDVLEVCDRVVVMRHGAMIGEIRDLSQTTPRDLVDLITGVTLGEVDTARHN